jgi:hypothetical protein
MTNQVAATILEQLGGKIFCMMTGAKALVASPNSLSFKIGGGAAKKINRVTVMLDADDTYSVLFYRGNNCAVVSTHTGIYCDMLRELFTRETGFYTSMRG